MDRRLGFDPSRWKWVFVDDGKGQSVEEWWEERFGEELRLDPAQGATCDGYEVYLVGDHILVYASVSKAPVCAVADTRVVDLEYIRRMRRAS